MMVMAQAISDDFTSFAVGAVRMEPTAQVCSIVGMGSFGAFCEWVSGALFSVGSGGATRSGSGWGQGSMGAVGPLFRSGAPGSTGGRLF